MFDPIGPMILPPISWIEALWRLKGLPTISGGSPGIGDMPSGGVPAFAVVELMDLGVSPPRESSLLRCGDFRVTLGSDRGSAECCRLSWIELVMY